MSDNNQFIQLSPDSVEQVVPKPISIHQLVDAVLTIDKYLKQPSVVRPADTDLSDLAIEDNLSQYELHKLYSMFELWLSVNNAFSRWTRSYSRVNPRIIKVLNTRMIFFQRAMLNVQAIAIARFLRHPNVNLQNLTIKTGTGTIKVLPEAYRTFLSERSGQYQPINWRYGTPQMLHAVSILLGPEPTLHAMKAYHNKVIANPFGVCLAATKEVSKQNPQNSVDNSLSTQDSNESSTSSTTQQIRLINKRPFQAAQADEDGNPERFNSTNESHTLHEELYVPINKRQITNPEISEDIPVDNRILTHHEINVAERNDVQDTTNIAKILMGLQMFRRLREANQLQNNTSQP